ncbi:TPA: hypothetical protein HA278_06050, partial [Candidatus Woesearchaeota archaeon]|nr:hypothetical protein [Candidatus Woesearchaeota archaeon]
MAELTEPVQGIYLFPGRDLVGASEIDYVVTPFLPVYDQVRADLGLQEQDATYLEGLQERLHSTP